MSVARRFVAEQQTQLAAVAGLIRELHAAGIPVAEALSAGAARWPFPQEGLGAAVTEGYLALGEAGQPGDTAAGGII
jgi:hypothetical protein